MRKGAGQSAGRCGLLGRHQLLAGLQDLAMRIEAPPRLQPAKQRVAAAAKISARPSRGQRLHARHSGRQAARVPALAAGIGQAPDRGPWTIQSAHCIHEARERRKTPAGWHRQYIGTCTREPTVDWAQFNATQSKNTMARGMMRQKYNMQGHCCESTDSNRHI